MVSLMEKWNYHVINNFGCERKLLLRIQYWTRVDTTKKNFKKNGVI